MMELSDRYVADPPWATDGQYSARDALKGFFVVVGNRRLPPTRQPWLATH
jgi:hypothetical protein